jgi:molecular chaperone HtpG
MAMGYDGKPFKSATQGSAELDSIPLKDVTAREEDSAAIGTLIAAIKQTLGDAVADVRRSERLTDSAVCIVADAAGLDRTLEKLLSKQEGTGVKVSAAILEINPTHPLIAALGRKAKTGGVTPEIEDAARLLLDQAHIVEGEPVEDPQGFARRLSTLLAKTVE